MCSIHDWATACRQWGIGSRATNTAAGLGLDCTDAGVLCTGLDCRRGRCTVTGRRLRVATLAGARTSTKLGAGCSSRHHQPRCATLLSIAAPSLSFRCVCAGVIARRLCLHDADGGVFGRLRAACCGGARRGCSLLSGASLAGGHAERWSPQLQCTSSHHSCLFVGTLVEGLRHHSNVFISDVPVQASAAGQMHVLPRQRAAHSPSAGNPKHDVLDGSQVHCDVANAHVN